jgi:hypothetical protein
MKQFPRPAQYYILLISGLGLIAAGASLWAVRLGLNSILIVLALGLCIAIPSVS